MSEKIERVLKELSSEKGDAVETPLEALDGIATLYVSRTEVVHILDFLKESPAGDFDLLVDITAIDWLGKPEKSRRFEVVYHLCSTNLNHRLRLKVRVGDDEPSVPTAVRVYRAADWLEREVYDMFGITFRGHPDMRRILTWEGFEGHPLRKDFPTRGIHPIERTPHS